MRAAFRSLKNNVYNYDDAERRIREATSNEEGINASTQQLQDIAKDTSDKEMYESFFRMLWRRLHDYQHIQHVMKGLVVVEYCLLHGDERFMKDLLNERRIRAIGQLRGYKFFHDGKEVASEVRTRAKRIVTMLSNEDTLKKDRKSAQVTAERMRGISSEDYVAKEKQNVGEGEPSYDDETEKRRKQKEAAGKKEAARAEVKEDIDPFDAFDFATDPSFQVQKQPGNAASGGVQSSSADDFLTGGGVQASPKNDDWMQDFGGAGGFDFDGQDGFDPASMGFDTNKGADTKKTTAKPVEKTWLSGTGNMINMDDPFAAPKAAAPVQKKKKGPSMAQLSSKKGTGPMGMDTTSVPNKDPFGDMAVKASVFGTPQNANPFGTFTAQPNPFGAGGGGNTFGGAAYAAAPQQAAFRGAPYGGVQYQQQGFGVKPVANANANPFQAGFGPMAAPAKKQNDPFSELGW